MRVAAAGGDGLARVWDVVTGKEIFPALKHNGAVTCAAFSPDGQLVLTASQDLDRKVAGVEDSMVQIKISANEDSLRYPPGLDARLSHLVNTVGSDTDSAPTEAAYREFDKLKQQVDQALASWSQIVSTDVASFDKLMQEQKVNPLLVQQGPETTSGGSK